MELEGRKELVDTEGQAAPFNFRSFGLLNVFQGFFWPKNGGFWP